VFDPAGYNYALVLKVTCRNVGSEPNRQRRQHLADEMGKRTESTASWLRESPSGA